MSSAMEYFMGAISEAGLPALNVVGARRHKACKAKIAQIKPTISLATMIEYSDRQIDDWERQGAAAYAASVPREKNPFSDAAAGIEGKRTRLLRDAWWRGWDSGRFYQAAEGKTVGAALNMTHPGKFGDR